MGKKLFVGNLAFSVSDDSLKARFADFGEVVSVKVVRDAETGRSRGFGFVEFSDDGKAVEAVSALNGQELEGRAMSVSEAREREGGARGGGGGAGGGGGRRFGGGSGGGRPGGGGGGGGGSGGGNGPRRGGY